MNPKILAIQHFIESWYGIPLIVLFCVVAFFIAMHYAFKADEVARRKRAMDTCGTIDRSEIARWILDGMNEYEKLADILGARGGPTNDAKADLYTLARIFALSAANIRALSDIKSREVADRLDGLATIILTQPHMFPDPKFDRKGRVAAAREIARKYAAPEPVGVTP
jgi:hypothetical protein